VITGSSRTALEGRPASGRDVPVDHPDRTAVRHRTDAVPGL